MRTTLFIAVLCIASFCYAGGAKQYQNGTLLQMDSVECGVDEKSGNSITGELIGTDSSHKKSRELLCQEYLLKTDKVMYRIRPRDDKHPILLPVGEKAQFRMDKDQIILRVEDLDDKDRAYSVVSMTPTLKAESSQ